MFDEKNERIIQLESVSPVVDHVDQKRYKLFGLTNLGRLFEFLDGHWQLKSNGVHDY